MWNLQVRLEKSALFHPTQATSCLSLLHVRGLPESPAGQNRLHAVNTLVDLTGTEQVGGPVAFAKGEVEPRSAHVPLPNDDLIVYGCLAAAFAVCELPVSSCYARQAACSRPGPVNCGMSLDMGEAWHQRMHHYSPCPSVLK